MGCESAPKLKRKKKAETRLQQPEIGVHRLCRPLPDKPKHLFAASLCVSSRLRTRRWGTFVAWSPSPCVPSLTVTFSFLSLPGPNTTLLDLTKKAPSLAPLAPPSSSSPSTHSLCSWSCQEQEQHLCTWQHGRGTHIEFGEEEVKKYHLSLSRRENSQCSAVFHRSLSSGHLVHPTVVGPSQRKMTTLRSGSVRGPVKPTTAPRSIEVPLAEPSCAQEKSS